MKHKLAIFDMDGTLFDTKRANYMAYKNAIEKVIKECPITEEQFAEDCFGKNYKEFLVKSVHVTAEEAEKIHDYKMESYLDNVKQFAVKNQSIFDILSAISEDYYLAIVTTASKRNTYEILEYFKCRDIFDLILTAEEIPRLKPEVDGYLLAMSYFSVNSQNTLIFEDSEICIKNAIGIGAAIYKVECFNGEINDEVL